MELEKLIIANEVRNKLDRYYESILHLSELIERTESGLKFNTSIQTNDGWGMQRIDVPQDALLEALPIIKESLERNVKKLEQQFKEL